MRAMATFTWPYFGPAADTRNRDDREWPPTDPSPESDNDGADRNGVENGESKCAGKGCQTVGECAAAAATACRSRM